MKVSVKPDLSLSLKINLFDVMDVTSDLKILHKSLKLNETA